MITQTEQKIRHTQQANLLIQAMEGDIRAIDTVLKYLGRQR